MLSLLTGEKTRMFKKFYNIAFKKDSINIFYNCMDQIQLIRTSRLFYGFDLLSANVRKLRYIYLI